MFTPLNVFLFDLFWTYWMWYSNFHWVHEDHDTLWFHTCFLMSFYENPPRSLIFKSISGFLSDCYNMLSLDNILNCNVCHTTGLNNISFRILSRWKSLLNLPFSSERIWESCNAVCQCDNWAHIWWILRKLILLKYARFEIV